MYIYNALRMVYYNISYYIYKMKQEFLSIDC